MADTDALVVTLRDVYLAVRKLEETVGTLTPQSTRLNDHEGRIRTLERWCYALSALVLAAGGSNAVAWLSR